MDIIRKIIRRVRHYVRYVQAYLSRMMQKHWYAKRINKRLKDKVANQEKIRVLFVCSRPTVWGSMKTVYEAFSKDAQFETMMVTIPQWDPHSPDGYVDEGADEYFGQYHPVRGFDPATKQYFNVKELNPDIVFYQQPYDIMREKTYYSNKVNKFAKIAYISYFSIFPSALNDDVVLNSCYPMDFFGNLTYFFAQNQGEYLHIQKLLRKSKITAAKVYLTGYPKYDNLQDYIDSQSPIWNYPSDRNYFRILWTPRWTTNENSCHFFDYKDRWFEYCRREPKIDFAFRPHPQAWTEWQNTGEFTKEQRDAYFEEIKRTDNMAIDEKKDYLEVFYSSDCLISDVSSMVLQYYLTGKPIIYCHKADSEVYFRKDSPIAEGMYWAESWDDVERYLQELRAGRDPLKEIRANIIRTQFQIGDDITAGEKVKEFIKADLCSMVRE